MSPHNPKYLESKVLTATPPRLHLMLIEGAIRFGRQAEELLRQGDTVEAAVPLRRVIDIVGEMLAGVREQKTEINKKLAGSYWFLFRRVCEAKLHCDTDKLSEALRLLEFERQTWTAVCERLGSTAAATSLPIESRPASASGLSLEA